MLQMQKVKVPTSAMDTYTQTYSSVFNSPALATPAQLVLHAIAGDTNGTHEQHTRNGFLTAHQSDIQSGLTDPAHCSATD